MHKPPWLQVLHDPSSETPKNNLFCKRCVSLTDANHSAVTHCCPRALASPEEDLACPGQDLSKLTSKNLQRENPPGQLHSWERSPDEPQEPQRVLHAGTVGMLQTVLPSSDFTHLLQGEDKSREARGDPHERQSSQPENAQPRCSPPAGSCSTLAQGHKAFAAPGDRAPDLQTPNTSQRRK